MNGREWGKMQLIHPFEPVVDENSRLLILGSFPSVKSRETQFYYGHKQNRFWSVLAQIWHCTLPQTVEEKQEMLLAHGVAVWDILKSCEIEGSSDASIRNPAANDIAGLIDRTDIAAVFFNGKTAYQMYQKHSQPLTVPIRVLPSTSPANAAYSLERLCEIWGQALSEFL